jgi:hypothetical protein
MSSGIVENRDRAISSRTIEMRDALDELELTVSPVANRDSGTFDSSSGLPGELPGEAPRLSRSASFSASSIRWSAEFMTDPGKECVQLYWVLLNVALK